VPVTLLSQIVKSASLKACQHQDGMSYYLSRTPATIGKRYPPHRITSPATRPPILAPARSLHKATLTKSITCFKHLYERR